MEITWLGDDSLLLRGREAKVLLGPGEQYLQTVARTGADLVVGGPAEENLLRPDSGPQVVVRPGEYELRGISVRGLQLGSITIFVAELEEVTVCSLGDLDVTLSDEAVEQLGFIDVMGVGLRGGTPARAQVVAQLIAQVQPAVMIPTGYQSALDAAPGELAAFVREMGLTQVVPQAKVTLSGSSGSAEETRVVILEPRR